MVSLPPDWLLCLGSNWADWVSSGHSSRTSPGGCSCLLTANTTNNEENREISPQQQPKAATQEEKNTLAVRFSLLWAIRAVGAQGYFQGQAEDQVACLSMPLGNGGAYIAGRNDP